ncbi:hypothetical protein TIFTF001_024891 [Ficus carica]|uniref:Uncharacterized protein n=1 Tax=Ficus carica TaxID=3494 RepID=A0AA88B0Z1_FICCA|nr:hypothetical protein TIFTF001_024891 [Ficus carica]
MAVEDELRTEGFSSSSSASFIRDSQECDEKKDLLSLEDIAWVDSCLIKESEISDGDWNSMKDASLEVLSSQSGLNSSASLSDGHHAENDIEMLTSGEGAEADLSLVIGEETEEFTRTPVDTLPIKEEAESSSENFLTKDIDDLHSLAFAGNPFLPSYIDGLKDTQSPESGTDSSSPVDDVEPSTNDIFRVWDLNIQPEENELGKQLNKILGESDLQSEPSAIDDSSAGRDLKGKDLKEESLDDIIAAISEISLN